VLKMNPAKILLVNRSEIIPAEVKVISAGIF